MLKVDFVGSPLILIKYSELKILQELFLLPTINPFDMAKVWHTWTLIHQNVYICIS